MPTANTVVIKRGTLSPPSGSGFQGPPSSGQTITIFDSTANHNGLQSLMPLPFSRIQFNLLSSHDSGASGVVFKSDFDGNSSSNFDSQSTQTYTAANGAWTYDYLMKGGQFQLSYTNSANTLTSWRYELVGILRDRNPGS